MIGALLALATSAKAQFKNQKTETVKISGNCEMCENTIEKAARKKGMAKADWNKDSKMAVITYDSKKQTLDEILKRIAHAGYDNEKYLAPDEAYNKLPACCQYKRAHAKTAKVNATDSIKPTVVTAGNNPLREMFTSYSAIKDALIKSDAKTVSATALQWKNEISQVDMNKMNHEQHQAWMQHEKEIIQLVNELAQATNLDQQRKTFSNLSEQMYPLIKIAGLDTPVYWQHCPMFEGGANWLSTDKTIKNPYYGLQMLSCGKTVETIGPE